MAGNAGNREKAASYIHRGLGRVEFFDFTRAQLEDFRVILDALAQEDRKQFSFHSPITRPEYFPYSGVTCFFLNEDPANRELSFRLLGHTLEHAKQWGAEYVVCHLTFGPTDTQDERTARELAVAACSRIAKMSHASGIPVDIEFAAYTDSFNRPDVFAETVGAHPELGVCIDIGHARLGALRQERDYLDDIAALAPAAHSMHLWNTKGVEHLRRHGHVPLHPRQGTEAGWIDVERALEMVLGENREVNVIFEYPVAVVTPDIQEGYDWIADVVVRLR
jgi:sugar phosphate isomerase/epimerase